MPPRFFTSTVCRASLWPSGVISAVLRPRLDVEAGLDAPGASERTVTDLEGRDGSVKLRFICMRQ